MAALIAISIVALTTSVALTKGKKHNDKTTVIETPWSQGFENNLDGWFDVSNEGYGSISRVESGEDGIDSSSGNWHAIVTSPNAGPFSRFDMYRDEWPGTWTAEIDVYLDPIVLFI